MRPRFESELTEPQTARNSELKAAPRIRDFVGSIQGSQRESIAQEYSIQKESTENSDSEEAPKATVLDEVVISSVADQQSEQP